MATVKEKEEYKDKQVASLYELLLYAQGDAFYIKELNIKAKELGLKIGTIKSLIKRGVLQEYDTDNNGEHLYTCLNKDLSISDAAYEYERLYGWSKKDAKKPVKATLETGTENKPVQLTWPKLELNEANSIALLKSLGYKILKPVTTFEEI